MGEDGDEELAADSDAADEELAEDPTNDMLMDRALRGEHRSNDLDSTVLGKTARADNDLEFVTIAKAKKKAAAKKAAKKAATKPKAKKAGGKKQGGAWVQAVAKAR